MPNPTAMNVLWLIMLLKDNYGNIDKKFQPSILNRRRISHVSFTLSLSDSQTFVIIE